MCAAAGTPAGRCHRPVGPAARVLLVAGIAALLLLSGAPGQPWPHAHTTRAIAASPVALPPHPHLRTPAGVHASSSSSFYTQEGVTVSQWDGSASQTTLPTIRTTVQLVNSPVSTGYELNGDSDAGDWYQLVIADNWPGCASGFEEVTEIWTNQGATGPVTCDPTLTLRAGDVVEFNLSFASSTSVCLTLSDRTNGHTHASCNAPPDSGGTGFESLAGTADNNGYFTGPMTEIVNTTASNCPDYTSLPTVSYSFLAPAWVTQYTPWADEFEYGGSGTYCFGGSPGIQSVGANDPTTSYFDNAAGSGFSSRWGGAQNDSIRVPGTTFRYATDPVRLLTVTAYAYPQTVALGGSAYLTAYVTGGVAPYGALWTVNGAWMPNGSTNWVWNATSSGTTTFVAYGVDAAGGVVGPSNSVQVYVPGPLSVSRIFASPAAASVDVGQPLTLTATVSGGISPYTFNWSGLPMGCTPTNTSSIVCTPNATGTAVVDLTVTDSNRSTVGTPSLIVKVAPDPTGAFSVSATLVEVGLSLTVAATASGGAGSLSYAWSGLPLGCSGVTARIQCTPTGSGVFAVDLTVSDGNGFALRLPSVDVTVEPPVGVALGATHRLVDVDQAVRITATVTGGGGGFTYAWSGLPAGCMAVNASTLLCTPTSSGPAVVDVGVIDGLGGTAEAVPISLQVAPALLVDVGASPGSVPAGTAVNISALVTGGSGTDAFAWSGLPSGCPAEDGPTILCAPDTVGSYAIQLAVTDAAGQTVLGNLTLEVTGPGGFVFPSGTAGLELVGALAVAGLAIVAAGLWAFRRRPRAGALPEAESPYR